MKNGVYLHLATQADPADCLEPPLPEFLMDQGFLVSYLSIDNLYIADVNDDPEREEEYEMALEMWAAVVQRTYTTLARWSGGQQVELSLSHISKSVKGLSRLLGVRRQEVPWRVSTLTGIPAELVHSLSSFGWKPFIWTTVADAAWGSWNKPAVSAAEIQRYFREQVIWWWMTHGYKEPFLVIFCPKLRATEVAKLLEAEVGLPIYVNTQEPFVPHRVRVHRRFS